MKRLVVAVAAGMWLVWSPHAAASTSSDTLGVSVTVVRTCSVRARAAGADVAAVRLACSSGHQSRVRVQRGDRSNGPRPVLVRPGATFHVEGAGGSPSNDLQVVTLNF